MWASTRPTAHGRRNGDTVSLDGAGDVGSVACSFGDFGGVDVAKLTRRADGGTSGDVSEDKATPHHGARVLPGDPNRQPIRTARAASDTVSA